MSRFDAQRKREWLADAMKVDVSEALEDANTRRMALMMLCRTEGYKTRLLAKSLGISIFKYQRMELGWEPMSRELFERAVTILDVGPERVDFMLQLTHKLLIDLDDAWPKVWREQLAGLDAEARRSLVLAERDLQNWGLGELFCDKSLEATDLDEAVSLAKLAMLVAEICPRGADSFHWRLKGYARAHLGHALQRRGDPAAESTIAQAVEEWMSGEGAKMEDEHQAERLAAIVPGFPKAEALKPRKRTKRGSARSG